MKCIMCNHETALLSTQEAEGLRVKGVNAAWRYLNRQSSKDSDSIWGGVVVGSIASSMFWLFIITVGVVWRG